MRSFVFRRRVALLAPTLAIFVVLAPMTTLAQTDSVATDGVGVARVSLIEGSVAVQRGDSADPLAAALNAPLLGGDYISTGHESRSEIQLDGSSALRLGEDTQVRFTHLDSGDRAIQLAQGTLEWRLLAKTGTNEIDTPSIAVKPESRGRYRVTVTSDGRTLVTVRSGTAEIDTPQGAQTLMPGATLTAQGNADAPAIQTTAAIGTDDFDSFNAGRDRLQARALENAAFVNTDIVGVADLSANGRWVNDASYGNVWVPASTRPDWAPYRDGRWVWEDGYGWTWVADEPWGWAPYHYGSWYHSPNYGWCWYPPRPRIYTPWRPALVAFFGFGAGPGLSLGFGGGDAFENIGWVPLAPSEPYHPWWGSRYGYRGDTTIVNNVTNITNVTNVTNVNVYRNVRYNGVSSVSSQRFLQGDFRRNMPVAAGDLRRGHVFHSALPVVPTASNLRFASSPQRSTSAARPAPRQRSFAGSGDVVRRTSFANQRVALANVTHASITPLNFKDARTTPMVPQRAWARFDHRRAIDPERRQTFSTPAALNANARPNAPANAPSAPRPTNRRPMYLPPTYRPPTYRPPADRPSAGATTHEAAGTLLGPTPSGARYRDPSPAATAPAYHPPADPRLPHHEPAAPRYQGSGTPRPASGESNAPQIFNETQSVPRVPHGYHPPPPIPLNAPRAEPGRATAEPHTAPGHAKNESPRTTHDRTERPPN